MDADHTSCDHDVILTEPVASEVIDVAAEMFRAMGDRERLRLLERLLVGETCVSELAKRFGVGQSTMSQRLTKLRTARLVVRRREGKHVHYALADEHVAELVTNALAHAKERR